MPDTLTPTELQILLNALPVAEEGHVITSAHINALRTAILNLAAKIGGTALSGGKGNIVNLDETTAAIKKAQEEAERTIARAQEQAAFLIEERGLTEAAREESGSATRKRM